MKLIKPLHVLIILFISFEFCLGQEKPKAVLVDRVNEATDESLAVRVNDFVKTVSNSNSKGLIIVYGNEKTQLTKFIIERKLRGCFRWGRYPVENFSFVLGENRNEFTIEFWKIPASAEKPSFNKVKLNYNLSKITEPKLIYQLSWMNYGLYCPLYFDMEFYSRFLKANQNIISKIIIHEKTLRRYNEEKRKYIAKLAGINKILPERVQFIRAKYEEEADAEFWLIPLKKR